MSQPNDEEEELVCLPCLADDHAAVENGVCMCCGSSDVEPTTT